MRGLIIISNSKGPHMNEFQEAERKEKRHQSNPKMPPLPINNNQREYDPSFGPDFYEGYVSHSNANKSREETPRLEHQGHIDSNIKVDVFEDSGAPEIFKFNQKETLGNALDVEIEPDQHVRPRVETPENLEVKRGKMGLSLEPKRGILSSLEAPTTVWRNNKVVTTLDPAGSDKPSNFGFQVEEEKLTDEQLYKEYQSYVSMKRSQYQVSIHDQGLEELDSIEELNEMKESK